MVEHGALNTLAHPLVGAHQHWLNQFNSKGSVAGGSLETPSYVQYFIAMDAAEGGEKHSL